MQAFQLTETARQLINRSNRRAEVLLRFTAQHSYELYGANPEASQLFGIALRRFEDGPIPWVEIPISLSFWLVEAFKKVTGALESAMPEFMHTSTEGNSTTYGSKLYYQSVPSPEAKENDEFWYLFCFQVPDPAYPPSGLIPVSEFNGTAAKLGYGAVTVSSEVSGGGGALISIDGEQRAVNQQKLETIGELASGVAHDFNNLIMGIQSNAEALLPQAHLTQRDRDTIVSIVRACSTGSSLTRSLLGYAKKQPLSMVRFNLIDMISDVSRIAGFTSKNNTSLELGQELQDKEGMLEVVACYSSLSHCLVNLIKNAREAMPRGGRVMVFWHGDDKTARLTIRDEGVGMSEDTLKHIFEPFFSTKKQGTGLGLAMVRGIMSQHSGTVEIKSEMNVGTSVSLVWPRFSKESEISSTGSVRSEPRKSTQQLLKQTAVVLISPSQPYLKKPLAYVVDDDDLVRDGLISLMQHLGHEVKPFSKPQEALNDLMTTNTPPKVLITDYNMPAMNGEQLITEYCKFARNNIAHAQVRILLMSGLPPNHFNDFIQKHPGMNLGTLEKPFSMETLRKKIENVQSLRKMTTQIGMIKPSKEMRHFVPRITPVPNISK